MQTRFLWLARSVSIGDSNRWSNGLLWVGGWDRCKVFFVVMVVKECPSAVGDAQSARAALAWGATTREA